MHPSLAVLGLPHDASEQGAGTDHLILAVHTLMFVLFVGWFCYFVFVLFRFRKNRNPKADYHGVRSHASSYAELLIVIVEAVLLVGFALPIWSRAVEKFPSEKDSTIIRVVAQQYQWNAWYPSTNGVFVKADPKFVASDNTFGFDKNDPNFKNNFVMPKDFLVPLGKPVIIYLSSLDVIHSFSCRSLRAMQDAIPGMSIPLHFTPAELGTYQINCAQLCGSGHYSMRGTVKVVPQAEYEKWVAEKSKASGGGAGYE